MTTTANGTEPAVVTPAATSFLARLLQPLVARAEAAGRRWLLHATGQAFVIYTAATHDITKWEAIVGTAGSALLATFLKWLQRRFGIAAPALSIGEARSALARAGLKVEQTTKAAADAATKVSTAAKKAEATQQTIVDGQKKQAAK